MLSGTLVPRCVHAGLLAASLSFTCAPETDLERELPEVPSERGVDSGASLQGSPLAGRLIDPPAGSIDIPTNLAWLLIRFGEAVVPTESPLWLRPGPAGGATSPEAGEGAVPVQLGDACPCDGRCYRLHPTGELLPSRPYSLEVPADALRLGDGKPVPAGVAGTFSTGTGPDTFAPRIVALSVTLSERCVVVAITADEPVRAQVALSAGMEAGVLFGPAVATTLEFAQPLPKLPPGARAQAVLEAADWAGNVVSAEPIAFDLPAAMPSVAITEVLANPAGSETTQEMVELVSTGDEAVELGGLVLADSAGRDVLPGAILAPGAVAVIVSEAYDAADGKDPAPRDGTVVLRVPGRLGGDGLLNAGELVELTAADGQVISRYGGWVDTSAAQWSGKSVKRASPVACDAPGAWSSTPTAPTPGW